MLNRYILVAAVLATSPLTAAAQFTTVITPPAKEPAAVAASPAAVARADSSQKAKLTDMKLWVDSAASALTKRDTTTRTDTVKTVVAPVAKVTPPVTHAHVSTGDSAALPDTATPLPAVALLGFTMLIAGLLMLRKRRA